MRFDPSLLVLLLLTFFSTPDRDAAAERVAFTRGGFSLELPEGWNGPTEVDESRFPGTATYRLRNTAGGPLAGASVTVTRRTGLNPMMRERWLQGRAPLGLGALRPIEALQGADLPFSSGAGFRVEGDGRAALVYFTAQGPAYYAVVAEVPAGRLAETRGALIGIVRSVRFEGAG